MEKYLENFNKLFAEDDQIVYKALMEKKDWILSNFYITCSLEDNRDIEDIIDGKLRFRKLFLNQEYLPNLDEYQEATEMFNNQFRVLYLDNTMPILDDDKQFIVKLDFNRLSDKEYMILFANFYPCLEKDEIKINDYKSVHDLILLSMDKMVGDNVLILDLNNLVDSCFNCRVVSEIIAPTSLNEGFKPSLKLTAESLGIAFKE